MNKKSRLLSVYVIILFSFVVFASIAAIVSIWYINTTDIALIILLISTFSSLLLFILVYYFWRRKTYIATEDIIFSSIETMQISERMLKRGIINYDIEGTIVYVSKWLLESGFKKYLGKDIEDLGLDMHNETVQELKINNFTYQFIFYYKTKAIIVLDITKQKELEQYIEEKQPAAILIKKTFSKKIKNDEIMLVKMNVEIDEIVNKWAESKGAISKIGQTSDQPIFIFGIWLKMKYDIEKELLLETVKNKLEKNYDEVSISIGVSIGNQDFISLQNEANDALNTATNKGGNQTVIFNPQGEILYVGESRLEIQEDSKEELYIFAKRLVNSLNSFKKIFITSHINADIDALASILMMYDLLKSMNKSIYIILPEMDQYTKGVFDKLPEDTKANFIKEDEAFEYRTKQSAMIILDVAFKERIQAKNLVDEFTFESIFIIDHHRVGENIILANKSNIYIDTTASSTSQLMYEILDLTKNSDVLDKNLPTVILSGIYLDTNVLTRNTSARTHEAVASLIKLGADSKIAADILKSKKEDIDTIIKVLDNSIEIGKNILFSVIPENKIFNEEDVSLLADKLLEYKGIDAGFVLAKINKKRYKLSARSNDNFNVQLVAEELSGGGHFNVAAVTWDANKENYLKLQKKIKLAISKQMKKKK